MWSSPCRCRSPTPVATPMPPGRMHSVVGRFASSTASTTNQAARTTCSKRRLALRFRGRRKGASTRSRLPTWRPLRLEGTRSTACTSCRAWDSAITMRPVSRPATSRRGSTTSSTGRTTTAAVASILAIRRPMAEPWGLGRWKRPTSARRPHGGVELAPGPGSWPTWRRACSPATTRNRIQPIPRSTRGGS